MTVLRLEPSLAGGAGGAGGGGRRGHAPAGRPHRRGRVFAARLAAALGVLVPIVFLSSFITYSLGRAVQQRRRGDDPRPGRGHAGRGRQAQPLPRAGPAAAGPVLALADPGRSRRPRHVLLHPDPGRPEHQPAAARRPVDRGPGARARRPHRRQRGDDRRGPPRRLVRPRCHRGVLGGVDAARLRHRHRAGRDLRGDRAPAARPTATSARAPAPRSG